MITTNTTKKELIQKLLDDKKVTMDEAFMLLDEPVATKEYIPYPTYPSWPYDSWPYQQPHYLHPGTTCITTALPGTCTTIYSGTAVCAGVGTITDTVTRYPEGTTMHYTNCSVLN